MPKFEVEETDDAEDPLFDPSDPLGFDLPHPDKPGERTEFFACIDDPQLPDDRHVNYQSQPRTFIVESLKAQVEEAQRRKLDKTLHKLLDSGITSVEKLLDLSTWLGDQREAARQRKMGRRTRRPTGGQ